MWEFLVRYCPKCKSDMVADSLSGWSFIDNIQRATGLKSFVSVHYNYRTLNRSCREPQYHWPEIEEFHVKFKRGFSTTAARDEWVAQTIEDVKVRKLFADNMRHWTLRQERDRLAELHKLRNARLETVKQRLCDEGWGDDLHLMNSWEKREFAKLKGVRTSQELTDHAWTTIRKHVVEHLSRVRERRLAWERHVTLCRRFKIMNKMVALIEGDSKSSRNATMDWRPTFADLAAQTDAFRQVLGVPRAALTKQMKLDLVQSYPGIIDSWLEARKTELAAAVMRSVASIPDGVSVLELAIATFDCSRCHWKRMR
ncbi:hypothetical protein C8T65DRAFT_109396 [Cerioporus squamosus]|nr:hypothetical protein C8T65DRAFT_109396 [Cerioporus squamosus]